MYSLLGVDEFLIPEENIGMVYTECTGYKDGVHRVRFRRLVGAQVQSSLVAVMGDVKDIRLPVAWDRHCLLKIVCVKPFEAVLYLSPTVWGGES